MLNVFIWNPNPTFFTLPYLGHPVTWYGVLFALGFFVGYFFIRKIFFCELLASDSKLDVKEAKLLSVMLTDRLAILVVLGTIIGARLGHIFFYGWPYYSQYPMDILKIWEGGLASHGGAVGIFIAIVIFNLWNRKRFPNFTFLATLDALVVPAAFVGGCIRIGNFINQEILGTPTNQPWGIIFLNPVGGIKGVPLHPVQIYEALFYFVVFALLVWLWKRYGERIGHGLLSGWFFLLVFTFRFFIEYLKLPQSQIISENVLNMGQILSIPFIILGVALLITYSLRKKSTF